MSTASSFLNKNGTILSKRVCVTILIIFCVGVQFAGCRNKDQKKAVPGPPAKSTAVRQSKPRLLKIDTALLASKKDLVCYMPLWTGIGDTCTYKGKIYGFCSKDCKDDFLKNPVEYIPK